MPVQSGHTRVKTMISVPIEVIEKTASLSNQTLNPVIFIAGLGASGKTSLCKELQNHFPNGVILETDWFLMHESEERKKKIVNGEVSQNPFDWYDWKGLTSALKALAEIGRAEIKNAWNQKTGKKDLNINLALSVGIFAPIFVDGIYLLHPEISQHADFRIFMDVPFKIVCERRIHRDKHRSTPEYLAQKAEWAKIYDIPYFEKYRNHADIVLS